MIKTNIEDTKISVFGILDGHGGEFAAVFAKDFLMEKLRNKIRDTVDVANGKAPQNNTTPDNEPEKQYEDVTDKGGAEESPSNKKGKLTKTMSTDVDCTRRKNCKQDQADKPNEQRITKESLLKSNNQNTKPIEHDANHYVDKEKKIDFHRMITDLVLLTDYELILKAKALVCIFFGIYCNFNLMNPLHVDFVCKCVCCRKV